MWGVPFYAKCTYLLYFVLNTKHCNGPLSPLVLMQCLRSVFSFFFFGFYFYFFWFSRTGEGCVGARNSINQYTKNAVTLKTILFHPFNIGIQALGAFRMINTYLL
jgi:hypothetical protein